MKMAFVTPLVFALFSFCLSCSLRPLVSAKQPPAQEKQVDVVTRDGKTVDVREASRNLHNRKIESEAWGILLLTKNVYLSSATVKLLKSVIAEHSRNSVLNDNSEDMRLRAVALLGLSRNPDAIDTVANRMFNDPSWRVRESAASGLGMLAGEKALPALLDALRKKKISSLSGGFSFAGGKAVPLIIRWMEKDFAKNGGRSIASTHASRLRWIGDRRAIEPLLRIIAHPDSTSDPTIDRVRFQAALTLAHFASEEWYSDNLELRTSYLAIPPSTLRKTRKVNATDRRRIIKALQNAGYDADWLMFPVTIY